MVKLLQVIRIKIEKHISTLWRQMYRQVELTYKLSGQCLFNKKTFQQKKLNFATFASKTFYPANKNLKLR